jgi:glycosyltransferase involved in cell wall biosynthesis
MDMGGIETNQVRLTRALVARGHDVTVGSSGGVLTEMLVRAGAKHVRLPLTLRDPRKLLTAAVALRRLVDRNSFDVLHVMSASANVATSLLSRPATRAWRLVSSPMGLENSDRERRITTDTRNRLLTWRADRVFVISPAIREALSRIGIPSALMADVQVVGLDERSFTVDDSARARFRAELGVPESAPLVSTIGALHRRKSPELFLQMASVVLARRPDAMFVLVGAGPEETALRQLSASLGVDRRVRFTGPLADVRGVLAASDVYVKPGIVEGFVGITVLEAMAASRPVVAFDTRDVRLAIEDGVTGAIAERGSADDLARHVIALLDDPSQSSLMGKAGFRRARDRFLMSAIVSGLELSYSALLD